MKGIILAGGAGTRLHPLTLVISKQLLPIYDKPMIYYPLTTLMLADIQEILVITTPQDQPAFKKLLGNGARWGLHIEFATQSEPRGLAEAFIIGRQFVGNDSVALILGDNLFYGDGLSAMLGQAAKQETGASIFAYFVNDPERYGIISFDKDGKPDVIEEKPQIPRSNWAVTGLYFYDNSVLDIAAGLKPSGRGELEITDINKAFLARNKLRVMRMGRGYAWFDAGTHNSLIEAGEFVRTIEMRQGLRIASPEEIAYQKGWISAEQLNLLSESLEKSTYGAYLKRLANTDMESSNWAKKS